MSRIGNRLLNIPNNVTVDIKPKVVVVTGQYGSLNIDYDPNKVKVMVKDNKLIVKRLNELNETKMLHGTINALINNALIGVSAGHTKKLKITGVGYKASVANNKITLNLGFSHPINLDIPSDLKVICNTPTEISVFGCDKNHVGLLAAQIRQFRPPEPYKGKGIAYSDEIIIRKVGKTAEGAKK